MGRSTAYDRMRRVHRAADLLAKGASNRQILQFAADQWGLKERTGREIIRKARELLAEDMAIERPDFAVVKLSTLDITIQKALKDNNLACVIGAVRLQCELVGILGNRVRMHDS